MGRGILKTLIGYLDKAAKKPPECREVGNGLKYTLSDAIKRDKLLAPVCGEQLYS
jgi:hypothetical protein